MRLYFNAHHSDNKVVAVVTTKPDDKCYSGRLGDTTYGLSVIADSISKCHDEICKYCMEEYHVDNVEINDTYSTKYIMTPEIAKLIISQYDDHGLTDDDDIMAFAREIISDEFDLFGDTDDYIDLFIPDMLEIIKNERGLNSFEAENC